LSGRILPVGGIKEKILAARRAGVKAVILPIQNKVDIEDLGEDVRGDIEIHLVERVEDIIDKVLSSN
jgi:ATP-dependent Lon protease